MVVITAGSGGTIGGGDIGGGDNHLGWTIGGGFIGGGGNIGGVPLDLHGRRRLRGKLESLEDLSSFPNLESPYSAGCRTAELYPRRPDFMNFFKSGEAVGSW